MHLTRIAPEDAWSVTLNWSRPMPYEAIISNGSRHDPDGWLYMILGYYGSRKAKIVYIGKVTQSYVSERLKNPDHQERYRKICRDNPRHTFKVSLAAIDIDGHITERRVDQIETMLIFTAYESQPSLINQRKWLTQRVASPYLICNKGCRGPLPREVHLGVFVR